MKGPIKKCIKLAIYKVYYVEFPIRICVFLMRYCIFWMFLVVLFVVVGGVCRGRKGKLGLPALVSE